MNETDSSEKTTEAADDTWSIARILRAMSADIARLIVVEAKLFGHTVLVMIGLTVVISMLLVGGWLFAGAAAVMALASLQAFSVMGALLTVALVNMVLAALVFWRLRCVMRDLRFRNSRSSVNTLVILARSLVGAVKPHPEEK
ncbi:hypothetical protein [Marinimicrobium alkaliphilum]|uniref:hypothetical protein n=1 Tax=Marinimicrobium alkaliphilum TaxID=2202654 RepID=UPI000DB92F51|nr:hypothetical protein [Marinimicrobium alkaliphilum]